VARWLKVNAPLAADPFAGAPEIPAALSSTSGLMEFRIPPASTALGRRLSDLDLPSGTLAILVGRRGYSFAPVASTMLEADDRLLMCAERTLTGRLSAILGAPPPALRDDRVLREPRRVEV
jgi:NhaP-type Na+/H+ and K+/H+ antiporter